MVDLEMAKSDPSNVFKHPRDVLKDKGLSQSDKIDILQRWAYEERELSVAEEENMPGLNNDKGAVLEEILNALLELGIESDHKNPPPTKHA